MAREQWVVESIGDATAGIEIDDGSVARVPRWLLPEAARVGDVLAVTRERSAGRTQLTVERDPAATRAALDASERQARAAPVDQGGGDVTL